MAFIHIAFIRRALLGLGFALTAATSAGAGAVTFGPDLKQAGWSVEKFFFIPATAFRANSPSTVAIEANRSAGLMWRPLPASDHAARTARWRWRVDDGVAPTDLSRKGRDDRDIAVYFVFGNPADAGRGALSVLASSTTSALVYVFGGDKPRGTIVPSPHMRDRGKFVVLRSADALKGRAFDETVDLAGDYAKAFGTAPAQLIGIAISSDSDDTGGHTSASVTSLVVGE